MSTSTSRRRARISSVALVLALAPLGACAHEGGGRSREPVGSALRVVVAAEDSDAELWVDGQYVGQISELSDPRIGPPLLAPGVHRVEVRKPGHFPVQRTVDVPRDAPPETTVEAELLSNPR